MQTRQTSFSSHLFLPQSKIHRLVLKETFHQPMEPLWLVMSPSGILLTTPHLFANSVRTTSLVPSSTRSAVDLKAVLFYFKNVIIILYALNIIIASAGIVNVKSRESLVMSSSDANAEDPFGAAPFHLPQGKIPVTKD